MTIWRVFKTTRVPHKFWVYHVATTRGYWVDSLDAPPVTSQNKSGLLLKHFQDLGDEELSVPWGVTDPDMDVDEGL